MKTSYVITEKSEDPKANPVIVGVRDTRDEAGELVLILLNEKTLYANEARKRLFNSGVGCGGKAIPNQFRNLFSVVEVSR